MIDNKIILLKKILEESIYPVLPVQIITMINAVPLERLKDLTEIRLRINQPLMLVLGNQDIIINPLGKVVLEYNEAYLCSQDDIQRTLQLMSKNSLYAFEHQLKLGFLTIDGGHRIGLTGQAIIDAEKVKTLKSINGLNIRLAREVKGCADQIIPYIITKEGQVLNTLIVSPPRCGKTTILRDLIRQISMGSKMNKGLPVGVVDERSEIAACKSGISTVDLGIRTDVLDSCPKAMGMLMLIRSMSPAVIATDELGRAEDILAVREALNAGVSVITTVHSKDLSELLHRPNVRELVESKYFHRYILLSDSPRIGTIKKIIDSSNNKILWEGAKNVEINR
ncbi:stage III sporulation protein AA [Pelosinus propionicus]|uniref:Stage III sporulation protein AA n=1 Tax=Pelosinus propionicus DSM 13327 TaxID=1123291 RepID=A0A1I4KS06_9FIRM|nr:stage III sporulation protein AA [Pelosinus propionicus]SFL81401.1 stage III sporulation protein AA [Pelosinus propionicus DSM 13327]